MAGSPNGAVPAQPLGVSGMIRWVRAADLNLLVSARARERRRRVNAGFMMAFVLVAGLALWAPTCLVICHRDRTRRDTRGILSFARESPDSWPCRGKREVVAAHEALCCCPDSSGSDLLQKEHDWMQLAGLYRF